MQKVFLLYGVMLWTLFGKCVRCNIVPTQPYISQLFYFRHLYSFIANKIVTANKRNDGISKT